MSMFENPDHIPAIPGEVTEDIVVYSMLSQLPKSESINQLNCNAEQQVAAAPHLVYIDDYQGLRKGGASVVSVHYIIGTRQHSHTTAPELLLMRPISNESQKASPTTDGITNFERQLFTLSVPDSFGARFTHRAAISKLAALMQAMSVDKPYPSKAQSAPVHFPADLLKANSVGMSDRTIEEFNIKPIVNKLLSDLDLL